jgi:hypothetical protein
MPCSTADPDRLGAIDHFVEDFAQALEHPLPGAHLFQQRDPRRP